MTVPDKIYITEYNANVETGYFSRNKDDVFTQEYIRKEALLEKIDKILNAKPDGGLAVDIAAQAFIDIKKVINSM